MVIFTSRLFDATYSPLILQENQTESDLRTVTRRVSRTATLDGGVVMDDAGFSDGDRTITVVVASPPESVQASLVALIEADGLQRITTIDGVFEGSIETITAQDGGDMSITFLVSEKLSA